MEVFIKKQNIEAVINTKGAELFSLKKDGKNYIWDVNTDFWNKTSPILFPIVGALKNGEYQYIQCIVIKPELEIKDSINFGEAQNPVLDTYADNVDTMKFLEIV